MKNISFYLAMSATIYIILSLGLLAMAERSDPVCYCTGRPVLCNCAPEAPPAPKMVVNKSRKSVGPLCLVDADCNHFCRPKKGLCNIDFETYALFLNLIFIRQSPYLNSSQNLILYQYREAKQKGIHILYELRDVVLHVFANKILTMDVNQPDFTALIPAKVPLDKLLAGKNNRPVVIRVLGMWEAKNFKLNGTLMSLDLLLWYEK
ncbi:hypothetical protein AALP_AA8G348000, partial [Arabis alpina]